MECLVGTKNFFDCGKDGHKVRYFYTIAYRGIEGNKVAPNVPKDDAPMNRRFFALRTDEQSRMRMIFLSPCISLVV